MLVNALGPADHKQIVSFQYSCLVLFMLCLIPNVFSIKYCTACVCVYVFFFCLFVFTFWLHSLILTHKTLKNFSLFFCFHVCVCVYFCMFFSFTHIIGLCMQDGETKMDLTSISHWHEWFVCVCGYGYVAFCIFTIKIVSVVSVLFLLFHYCLDLISFVLLLLSFINFTFLWSTHLQTSLFLVVPCFDLYRLLFV